MNTVSLLFYLANLVENVQNVINVISVFSFVGIIAYTFAYFLSRSEANRSELQYMKENDTWNGRYRIFPFVTLICLMVFSVFIPNRETVLLIAASETTEVVLNTEIGKEGQSYIREYLQNEIFKLREKVKKDAEPKRN